MSEEFVPLPKAAAELGVTPAFLEEVIARRELAAFPAEGWPRIRRSDLDRYKARRHAQETVVFPTEKEGATVSQEAAGVSFQAEGASAPPSRPVPAEPGSTPVRTVFRGSEYYHYVKDSKKGGDSNKAVQQKSSPRAFRIALAGLLGLAVLGAAGYWAWDRFRPDAKTDPEPAPVPPAAAAALLPAPPAPRRAAAGSWATAGYCPPDTVAFLGVRDLQGLAVRVMDSGPCKPLLADLARARDLGPVEAWLRALGQLPAGETALVITGIETSAHYRPIPHLLLMVRPDEPSPEALAGLAEGIFAALAQDTPRLRQREAVYAGIPVRLLGDGDVTFARAIHRGTLIVASDEATLRRALDLADGTRASLGSQAVFSELRDGTGGRDLFAYVGMAPLWEDLPAQALPPEGSGLLDIDGIAYGLESGPQAFVERLALHTRGPRSGFLALLDAPPLGRPLTGAVPARLLSFCQARVAPLKAWDGMLGALKAQRPDDHARLLEGLEAIRRDAGFRLREDLVRSLGDTVTATLAAGEDPARPDPALAWTLADPAACLSCVGKTLEMLDLRHEARPFRRRWAGGAELFEVDPREWDKVMPMAYPGEPAPFAFGVLRGSLVLAGRREGVPSAAAREQLPPGLEAALAPLPAQAWAVSYTDLRALLNNLGFALQVRGIPLPPALAGWLQSDAPLPPAVAALTSTPRSVVLESRALLPLIPAALATGLFLYSE